MGTSFAMGNADEVLYPKWSAFEFTAAAAAEANTWLSVTCGNGRFVAVAQEGANQVMDAPWAP